MPDLERPGGEPGFSPGARRSAAGLLGGLTAAVLAVGIGLGPRIRGHGESPSPNRIPPTPVTDRAGVARLVPPPGSAAVLLYVDQRCPFCRQAVERWARAVRRTPTVPFHLILSPATAPSWIDSIPSVLAPAAVWDVGGDLARAMGVRRVPHVVLVDPEGRVVRRRVGLDTEKEIHAFGMNASLPPMGHDSLSGREEP